MKTSNTHKNLWAGISGAVLGIAGLLIIPASAAAGTFPGKNGRLLITDITGPAYHFTSVKADGTDTKTVMQDSTSKLDVEYSPDGTKIAYIQSVSSTNQVWIANADGTNAHQITSSLTQTYSPSWSPDGTKILFSKAVSSQVHIFKMDTDGSNQTEITSSGIYYDPEYSPDGTKILALLDSTDDEVVVMNSDGSNVVNLTNNSVDETKGSWSPDGTKIIYASDVSGTYQIFTMNANGSGQTQLINDTEGFHNPEYSPDGTKITFMDTLAPGAIYVANTDGSNIQQYLIGWPREISWQTLTKAPSSSTPNPTISVSAGKATVNIASMYTDAYDGIDKATVAATSTPTYGTTSVDASTGVITYTPKTTASRSSLISRFGSLFFPKVSAATTDSFTYKVCSLTNSGLCSSGTVTVNLLGAPNTGFGHTGSSLLNWGVMSVSIAALGLGLDKLRRQRHASK